MHHTLLPRFTLGSCFIICMQDVIVSLLQDIAEDYSDYLDAYLRLACIERKQGNLKKAIDWAEKGIDRADATSKGSSSHTDLLAMAGWSVTHKPAVSATHALSALLACTRHADIRHTCLGCCIKRTLFSKSHLGAHHHQLGMLCHASCCTV